VEVSSLDLKHKDSRFVRRDILADGIMVYDGKAGTFAMAF